MAADVLDDNSQLNDLLLALREEIRKVMKRQGYGRIMVDGVIHAGMIVGTVECGVCPRKHYGPIPKLHTR